MTEDDKKSAPVVEKPKVTLPSRIMVRDLGEALNLSHIDIIKELMKRGVMASVNQTVDFGVASAVATELGFDVEQGEAPTASWPTPPASWPGAAPTSVERAPAGMKR